MGPGLPCRWLMGVLRRVGARRQLARLEAAHADLETEHAQVTGEQAARCKDLEAALGRERQRVQALERRWACGLLAPVPELGSRRRRPTFRALQTHSLKYMRRWEVAAEPVKRLQSHACPLNACQHPDSPTMLCLQLAQRHRLRSMKHFRWRL